MAADNFVICECTRASDYSSWEAFISDVQSTFDTPLGLVATIAIIAIAIIFPLLFLIWFVLVIWGHRQDYDDADLIHCGAFYYFSKIEFVWK